MQRNSSILVLAMSIVALGMAAYALILANASPPAVTEPGPRVSLEDALDRFEERLAALEADGSVAPTTGTDPRILSRLDDLDRRVSSLTASPGSDEGLPPDAPATVDRGEPDSEEVERFQKLARAAGHQKRARYHRTRIDRALAETRITLSDEQKDRLVDAYGAFEARRNEIWGEAKRSGAEQGAGVDWERIIADTQQVLEREFAERISPFIPRGDAEVLARSLHSGGK